MSHVGVLAALWICFVLVADGAQAGPSRESAPVIQVDPAGESALETQSQVFVVTNASGKKMKPIPHGTVFEATGAKGDMPFCIKAWLGVEMQIWEKKACQFTGKTKPDVTLKAHGMEYKVHYYGCEFLDVRLEVHKGNLTVQNAKILSFDKCNRLYAIHVPTCATTNATMCQLPRKMEIPSFREDVCMTGECDEEHCCMVKTCALANASVCSGGPGLVNTTHFASQPCEACDEKECCADGSDSEDVCRVTERTVKTVSYAIIVGLLALGMCCGAGFVLLYMRS